MVPEYLTPSNGGLLSPGQVRTVMRVALLRFGGPQVMHLVLDIAEGPVGQVRGRGEGSRQGEDLS